MTVETLKVRNLLVMSSCPSYLWALILFNVNFNCAFWDCDYCIKELVYVVTCVVERDCQEQMSFEDCAENYCNKQVIGALNYRFIVINL